MDEHIAEDRTLNSLLKKSQDRSLVLPDELSYLATSFLPSRPPEVRSKAYLVLSAFCQGARTPSSRAKGKEKAGQNDDPTESLRHVFQPLIASRFSEHKEEDIVVGASFWSALFQVDWQSASSIFQQDGMLEFVTDSIDLRPTPSVCLAIAHLLGQATGYKACRALIPLECLEWLQSKSRQTTDSTLRAAAAIALVKLSRGSASDAASVEEASTTSQQSFSNDEELVKLLKGMTLSEDDQSSLGDAVEGLAYLSADPKVKEDLASDSKFLSRLFRLVRPPKAGAQSPIGSTTLYGIIVIILNLCAYRPRLSQEEAQIEKLRRMAKAGNRSAEDAISEQLSPLDDDNHVKARARLLIRNGVLDVLTVASTVDSQGIRTSTGKIYLYLVEEQENRGRILQSGGAKNLMRLIRELLPSASAPSSASKAPGLEAIDISVLQAIQALAKLAITASPIQVFGPNEGAVYDAIRPFSALLLSDSSTLLQQFEALMALTNLSSLSPQCALRIGRSQGLLNKAELLLLEDHTLIRRAATELICNLIVGSDEIFVAYGGEKNHGAAKSKLQILLAMSDVEDLPTRLAASGALATITVSPSASGALFDLQMERHRVFPILAQLVDPTVSLPDDDDDDADKQVSEADRDPRLAHRGIICLRNMLLTLKDIVPSDRLMVEVQRANLVQILGRVLKGEAGQYDAAVLRVTAEILQFLLTLNNNLSQ